MEKPIEVTVRSDHSGYKTQRIQGKIASCAYDARLAVERLADRLFPTNHKTIERLECTQVGRLHSKWLITPGASHNISEKPNLDDMGPGELRLMCANLQDRVTQLETAGKAATVVGRVYSGSAELNSIGRALPDGSPLYAKPDVASATLAKVVRADAVYCTYIAPVEKAIQQLTGFLHAGSGYDLLSLTQDMGLEPLEWQQIKQHCSWIPENMVQRIDQIMARQEASDVAGEA
ncbi:MAG: hypothetical protein CVV07_01220 [Gammaproteobacteria bacterium HGW-Gammaproteobacteria-11]|nr:MAG: hypothetical protein CVV07_01220 [Gammaproteobacteria bacterium HGW-Gammaproteobacteria-11]